MKTTKQQERWWKETHDFLRLQGIEPRASIVHFIEIKKSQWEKEERQRTIDMVRTFKKMPMNDLFKMYNFALSDVVKKLTERKKLL